MLPGYWDRERVWFYFYYCHLNFFCHLLENQLNCMYLIRYIILFGSLYRYPNHRHHFVSDLSPSLFRADQLLRSSGSLYSSEASR